MTWRLGFKKVLLVVTALFVIIVQNSLGDISQPPGVEANMSSQATLSGMKIKIAYGSAETKYFSSLSLLELNLEYILDILQDRVDTTPVSILVQIFHDGDTQGDITFGLRTHECSGLEISGNEVYVLEDKTLMYAGRDFSEPMSQTDVIIVDDIFEPGEGRYYVCTFSMQEGQTLSNNATFEFYTTDIPISKPTA